MRLGLTSGTLGSVILLSVIFVTGVPRYADENVATLEKTNPGVECIVIDDELCRSRGLNRGAKIAKGETLLFVDDDIVWTGSIAVPNAELFGPSLLPVNHITGFGRVIYVPNPWLDGWCIGVSRQLYNEVGGFDENFIGCGFQDADFCMSCAEKNALPEFWEMPGKHLYAGTKHILDPDHEDNRFVNIKYLIDKWEL